MATKARNTNEGAPRWTYIAGAIVAIGGLVWGVASTFMPKAETTKLSGAVTPPPISVSGNNNTTFGSMSGGSISINGPASQSTAVASAPATRSSSK